MLGSREPNEPAHGGAVALAVTQDHERTPKFESPGVRSTANVVPTPAMPSTANTTFAASRHGQNDREHSLWKRLTRTTVLLSLLLVLCATLIWRRTATHARDPKTGTYISGTYQYFVLCFCGGIMTGLSHLAVTPLDVVKCRIQVGAYSSFSSAFREMFDVECRRQWSRVVPVFFRGWVPIAFGYCGQGAVKFCLYEMLKCAFMAAWAQGGKPPSTLMQTFLFLTASFIAELLADFVLCPWETLKIKIQTSSQTAQHVSVLLPRLWMQEGWRSLYAGLIPLWLRQVPYTMMKFASFEHIATLVRKLFLWLLQRPTLGSAMQLFVTMLAGIFAGVLCAVVSHPADTVLSRLSIRKQEREEPGETAMLYTQDVSVESTERAPGGNLSMRKANPTTDSRLSAGEIIRGLGWRGLWRGVGPRIAMVAAITSLQWLLYDAFKVMVGLPASSAAPPPPSPTKAAM